MALITKYYSVLKLSLTDNINCQYTLSSQGGGGGGGAQGGFSLFTIFTTLKSTIRPMKV